MDKELKQSDAIFYDSNRLISISDGLKYLHKRAHKYMEKFEKSGIFSLEL
jgi:hypothetical protein